MRNYQPKKHCDIPETVWYRALWTIRSYDHLKKVKTDVALEKTRAIEKGFDLIPDPFKPGVVQSVMYEKAFPKDAPKREYSRFRNQWISFVAKEIIL